MSHTSFVLPRIVPIPIPYQRVLESRLRLPVSSVSTVRSVSLVSSIGAATVELERSIS